MGILVGLVLICGAFYCGVRFHSQIMGYVNKVMRKGETLVPLINGRMIGAQVPFADYLKKHGTSGNLADDVRGWQQDGGPSEDEYRRYVSKIAG